MYYDSEKKYEVTKTGKKKEEVVEELSKLQKEIAKAREEVVKKKEQIKELKTKKHSVKSLIFRNQLM